MKIPNSIVYSTILVVFLVFVVLITSVVILMSKRDCSGIPIENTTPSLSEGEAHKLVMTTTTSKLPTFTATDPTVELINTVLKTTTTSGSTVERTTPKLTTSSQPTTTAEPTTTPEPTTTTEPTTTPEPTTTTEPTTTPTTTTTPEPTTTIPKEKLVYAQVLFRTGARESHQYSDQLTYHPVPLIKTKWVTRSRRSCLETSEIVMTRMFDVENSWSSKWDSSKTDKEGVDDFKNIYEAVCHAASSTFQSLYPRCGQSNFFCMLRDRENFMRYIRKSEFIVYENKTGGGRFDDDEVAQAMYNVSQFEMYKNYFDNEVMFTAKYFYFIRPILDDLREAWDSYKANNSKMKFNVFSTEDWILLGILKAFNVFGNKFDESMLVEWNSLVMIELWDVEGDGFVKFYLKKGEKTDESSIIEPIHQKPKGCENSDEKGCSIEIFLKSTGFEKINIDEFCKSSPPTGNR